MRHIAVVCAILLAFARTVGAAADYPQIMIRAEFIAVPKAVFDSIGRGAPDQLPSAKQILGLKQSGQATVLHSPTILLQSGQESTVKAVEEVIYPTDFDITSRAVTNAHGQAAVATVITPSSFETREVGVIFSALPELDATGMEISLNFQAELVAVPVWRQYAGQYTDTIGNAKTAQLDQPFFFTRSVKTSLRIKNGTTILAGGGWGNQDDQTVTFLLIKVQLVNSMEQPVTVEPAPGHVR
jgi:Flp pilus assembly secretin CpaC